MFAILWALVISSYISQSVGSAWTAAVWPFTGRICAEANKSRLFYCLCVIQINFKHSSYFMYVEINTYIFTYKRIKKAQVPSTSKEFCFKRRSKEIWVSEQNFFLIIISRDCYLIQIFLQLAFSFYYFSLFHLARLTEILEK